MAKKVPINRNRQDRDFLGPKGYFSFFLGEEGWGGGKGEGVSGVRFWIKSKHTVTSAYISRLALREILLHFLISRADDNDDDDDDDDYY